ncbi:hypothetical protein SADUNF_Sadunf03G0023600 [Salix dunnii]|uniref:Uncharacterized protein n=1 Tax=Salix dunnii TaxID=1413687 RepID=A0A835KFP3_9ROSI|nr:hypothetical protein SADUNF_Sadunf03G0023600 [Salix dunnii]
MAVKSVVALREILVRGVAIFAKVVGAMKAGGERMFKPWKRKKRLGGFTSDTTDNIGEFLG